MKKTILLYGIAILLLTGCSTTPSTEPIPPTSIPIQNTRNTIVTSQNTGSVAFDITSLSTGRSVPRGIAIIDDNTMYITERQGTIYKLHNGIKTLYHTISNTRSVEEAGLMGITLDPDYQTNKYIYVSVATSKQLQIIRFTDSQTGLESATIIFDMLPVAQYHAGGGLKFGPDGMLYLSVGDAQSKEQAQNLSTYHGKILRIHPDGSTPADNPFAGSAIWSYGHRNIQGFDRTADGMMIASEHGPSGFDGQGGGDEINKITYGGNYGRPVVSHTDSQSDMIDPILVYTPAVAPSGLIVYTGTLFPQWTDKILVATLRGQKILIIDPITQTQIDEIAISDYGRIRALAQLPNGEIIFATSNTDGRGTPRNGDDMIYKISAK